LPNYKFWWLGCCLSLPWVWFLPLATCNVFFNGYEGWLSLACGGVSVNIVGIYSTMVHQSCPSFCYKIKNKGEERGKCHEFEFFLLIKTNKLEIKIC